MLKKIFSTILVTVFCSITVQTIYAQGIGINETGASPDPSAILDASSTSRGFLPPRMTAAQRDAIATPAQGLMIYCTNCGANGEAQLYNGAAWVNLTGGTAAAAASPYPGNSVFCASGATAIVDVTNPTTGEIWMDRNLGATQVATSSTDANSYGDLYQWGRRADGHQCRNSATTASLSSSDNPGHGDFILAPNSPRDWRSPQNTNLWQGVNGVNNPCPSGYRIPTEAEWNDERSSWTGNNNAAGAFASPLKLPLAGDRFTDGSLNSVGTNGSYWSSTVSSPDSRNLFFNSSIYDINTRFRANGYSVRCIKD